MKAFSSVGQELESTQKVQGQQNRKLRRKAPSEAQIRAKLKAHAAKKNDIQTNISAKAKHKKLLTQTHQANLAEQNEKDSSKAGPAQEKIEAKPKAVAGDISENDPSHPETLSKLKDVLRAGAFDFGPEAKNVLEKILKDS